MCYIWMSLYITNTPFTELQSIGHWGYPRTSPGAIYPLSDGCELYIYIFLAPTIEMRNIKKRGNKETLPKLTCDKSKPSVDINYSIQMEPRD